MYLSVCVCIHSFHTLSSHCSFDLQKAVVKDFLTEHKCIAADQSTHRAMRLVTKRRDPRPKYFLPSVAIHRSSNIRPPPIYSFLPTSAPSSVTTLMGGHPDWLPAVGWVVTVIGHQWDGWSLVTDSDPESAIEGYQHLVAGEANARS